MKRSQVRRDRVGSVLRDHCQRSHSEIRKALPNSLRRRQRESESGLRPRSISSANAERTIWPTSHLESGRTSHRAASKSDGQERLVAELLQFSARAGASVLSLLEHEAAGAVLAQYDGSLTRRYGRLRAIFRLGTWFRIRSPPLNFISGGSELRAVVPLQSGQERSRRSATRQSSLSTGNAVGTC